MRVESATGRELDAPLRLLEESLREGEPLPEEFVARFRRAVEAGDYEVLVARDGNEAVGVVVLSYRLSVSAGGWFVSVEELYVRPGARRRGMGRALLGATAERCARWGVSYVEAQVIDEVAEALYEDFGFTPEVGVTVMSFSRPLGG